MVGEAVQKLVNAAQKAQPAWYRLGMDKRVAILTKFNDIVRSRAASIAEALSGETHKPIQQALGEINSTHARVAHFIAATPKVLAPQDIAVPPPAKQKERLSFEPLGVVANVSAWNYPMFVGTNVFVPALLAGNAVVYKPSEYASRTGDAIGQAMRDAGVPADIFTVLQGDGAVGRALVRANGIGGVFFTGSVPTGKAIAADTIGSGRLIKLQLELGGKDAMYIADDVASVDAAAEAVLDGAMYNNGQSCCSVERIYVHRAIYPAFLESITRQAKALKIGRPAEKDTYITTLTRGTVAVEHLERQLVDATKKGGRILTGGTRSPTDSGCFLPTIVADATNSMLVMRDESFGPIVGVAAVGSDEEAIQLINDSEYGLTAGIYTSNPTRAESVLAQLQVGTVYSNACDSVSVRMPWTGRKDSGLGGTCGDDGIRAFTHTKGWILR